MLTPLTQGNWHHYFFPMPLACQQVWKKRAQGVAAMAEWITASRVKKYLHMQGYRAAQPLVRATVTHRMRGAPMPLGLQLLSLSLMR
jgi:hypothetical protein